MIRKDIMATEETEDGKPPELKRVLGPIDLVVIGVAGSVGAGVFAFSGVAAARYAGPAVVLSYLFAGFCALFFCAPYAEMAAMIPNSAGACSFATVAFGRFLGWLVGWSLIAEYMFAASAVSIAWSAYFTGFFHQLQLDIPQVISTSPIDYDQSSNILFTGAWFNLPAVLLIFLCSGVVMVGAKEFSLLTAIILSVKVGTLILFVLFGCMFVNPHNWDPFIPPEASFGHFGWTGVLRASSLTTFAFIGFDAIATAAKESLDPVADMPVAMFSTIGICIVLYSSVSLVLTGLVSYTALAEPDPLIVAATAAGPGFSWIIPFIQVALASLVDHPLGTDRPIIVPT
jgi:APA family basic amino acid/polyamine antiporter